jgi:hypothetical protein
MFRERDWLINWTILFQFRKLITETKRLNIVKKVHFMLLNVYLRIKLSKRLEFTECYFIKYVFSLIRILYLFLFKKICFIVVYKKYDKAKISPRWHWSDNKWKSRSTRKITQHRRPIQNFLRTLSKRYCYRRSFLPLAWTRRRINWWMLC